MPRAVGRRSRALSAIAADGHVLLSLGPVAAVLPLVALAGGLYVGATHPGFEVTYTESLTLVLVALVLGTMSTQLSALATLGFVAGDFFIYHTSWSTEPSFGEASGWYSNPLVANLVFERVPLLIQYLLLVGLAVGVPAGARGLARSLAGRLHLPDGVKLVVTAVLIAVTAFVLARFWASAAPLVIRPVFTWTIDDGINGGTPPAGAIVPVQTRVETIARVAAVAVFARAAFTWLAGKIAPRRLHDAEQALLAPLDSLPRRRGWVGAISQALLYGAIGMLLLAGMLDTWLAALAVGAVFAVARLSKSGWLPIPTRRWREVVNHVPVVVRFGAVLLVMNGVAKAVWASGDPTGMEESFQFMVWPVVASVLLMAFAMPDPIDHEVDAPDPPVRPPTGGGPSPRTTVFWSLLALTVLSFGLLMAMAEPAAADNCGTPTDCFSTADAASDSLVGLGFLGMLSMALNFIPYVGTAKGVVEAVVGYDILTGEQLSTTDRLLGLIPGGRLGRLGRLGRFGDDAGDLARGIPVRPRAQAGVPGRPRPPLGGPGRGGPPSGGPPTGTGGRGGPPRRPPGGRSSTPEPEPPHRPRRDGPPEGSTPDRRGSWGDDRSRVQHWRETWWNDRRPTRTANGDETVTPRHNPSENHRPVGEPEGIDANAGRAERWNKHWQNKNADVLSQHGFDVRQMPERPAVIRDADGNVVRTEPPMETPQGGRPTADYNINGRYFDHKVPETSDVDSFADHLDRQAGRFHSTGRQADRFVVDLDHGSINDPGELRAAFERMQQQRIDNPDMPEMDVQEIIGIKDGNVIPIFP